MEQNLVVLPHACVHILQQPLIWNWASLDTNSRARGREDDPTGVSTADIPFLLMTMRKFQGPRSSYPFPSFDEEACFETILLENTRNR